MINDIIIKLVDILNTLYTTFIAQRVADVLSHLGTWTNYTTAFTPYLQGVYFIVGKPLCMYIITAFVLILILRLVFAVINIVGQYVP